MGLYLEIGLGLVKFDSVFANHLDWMVTQFTFSHSWDIKILFAIQFAEFLRDGSGKSLQKKLVDSFERSICLFEMLDIGRAI